MTDLTPDDLLARLRATADEVSELCSGCDPSEFGSAEHAADYRAAADLIDSLTAERDGLAERNATLEAIAGEEATFRDLEMKMRDGGLDLRAVFGEEGGSPAARFIAALLLNIVLGDGGEPEEPPNYRSAELSMKPAGEFEPFRAFLEVVKQGGKSSHELRRELEAERDEALAEVAKLREALSSICMVLRDEDWQEAHEATDIAAIALDALVAREALRGDR